MPPSAPPAHYETSDVRIDKYVVGPFENNVFVVRCKGSGDAVIIDAANEHELLLEVSRATGVRRVLTDPSLAAELRRKGPLRAREFSWARSVARTKELYEAVAAGGH